MKYDELCEESKVYKVETIGDAYFVSANCPIDSENHATDLINLGKQFVRHCWELNWKGYKVYYILFLFCVCFFSLYEQ